MTALEPVAAILDGHAIAYALIGAAALAARGVVRSTLDIDLLTTDRRAFESSLWAPLTAHVDIRVGDADDPLAGVIRIAADDEDRVVDIVVGKHQWQTRAVSRAEQLADGRRVVLARDLILLKLYAGGAQDFWDVRELLKHSDASLAGEVESDVAEMPAEFHRRWQSIATEL
jgi:hypothetical protein